MPPRKPDPAASLAADLRHMPLCVTGGIGGYRLAYVAGEFCQPITLPVITPVMIIPGVALEWPSLDEAQATRATALDATSELLARVLQS